MSDLTGLGCNMTEQINELEKAVQEPESARYGSVYGSSFRRAAAILLPFLQPTESYCADPSIAKLIHQPPPCDPREFAIPDGSSGFALSAACARFLVGVVLERRCRNILEFGAGASSLVFARALAHCGGGCLTSVEQAPQWCRAVWEQASSEPNVDAVMVPAEIQFQFDRRGAFYSYKSVSMELERRAAYDLILIDAPQGYFGRDGAFDAAMKVAAPGALIVLDDASRWKERWSMHRWMAAYEDVVLAAYVPDFGKSGIAVLQVGGPARARASAIITAASACHAAINYIWRARHRRSIHYFGTT